MAQTNSPTRCLFRRVVCYATLVPDGQIFNAFGPAITSIRACWGRQLECYDSVLEPLMLDRWASNMMVIMGERSRGAQLFFRLNLATNGWQSDAPLPLCNCNGEGIGPMQSAKRWIFVKTNNPGKATTLTLSCSWCKISINLQKPPTMPHPRYVAGEYYRIMLANDLSGEVSMNTHAETVDSST
jgi:hypothetical protein